MSVILVQLPDQTQVLLSIEPDTLVYDGEVFVSPEVAKYVALYNLSSVSVTTLPWGGLGPNTVITSSGTRAKVLQYNPVTQPYTDSSLVVEPDPSLGVCVCFITCKGTLFSYVKVTST